MSNVSGNTGKQIILRSTQPQDDSFLFQVYASTRTDEMALVNWSAEQKTDFLQMQFSAQRLHYLNYFPHAEHSLICREDGRPIGRIIIDRSKDEILLIDIALLPEYRNTGIGTRLIRELLDEAQKKGQPVYLYVEVFNPAQHLYERLGFSKIGMEGIYFKMEWRPETVVPEISSPASQTNG
jgi:ribosomal protein S18 acetylase RimI-like enzyme